jgi:DNA-nicking Smr family endonuclease
MKASGGKRNVSAEERALFLETLKHARPLKKAIKRKAPKTPALKNAEPKSETPAKPRKREYTILKPEGPKAPPLKEQFTPPAIGGHRAAHLRRGKLEPEARLDLHGFTQDEAYRALQRFLMRAADMQFRVVLVITGKGGVLRGSVPRWLAQAEFRSLISGVGEAHVRHGGGGALYVSVRRKRDKA